MSEKGILFLAPMVRAILAGTKTQTRRVVTGLAELSASPDQWRFVEFGKEKKGAMVAVFERTNPYRAPNVNAAAFLPIHLRPRYWVGDTLWVRETCRAHELTDKEAVDDTYGVAARLGLEEPPYGLDGVIYAADGVFREIENSRAAAEAWGVLNAYGGKKGALVPSIHMPRWAARILLTVTAVRAERLNDISGADVLAEGLEHASDDGDRFKEAALRWGYRTLWESINGKGSWAVNPWVFAYTFERRQS